jgi:hypothetical protein
VGPRTLGALVALVAAVALTGPAVAAARLPAEGILVPGESLGGIRVGMTKAAVRSTWGRSFGRCRSCGLETWYYTYRTFQPQGAAVALERGRAQLVYTLWQPSGWRTARGLALGAAESDVTGAVRGATRRECDGYVALIQRGRSADSIYYLVDGGLWGFGLTRSGFPPCP